MTVSPSTHAAASWRHTIPAAGHAEVHRADLTATLVHPQALTLLRAPAGTGKTTLAAQWARMQTLPVAWVSFTMDDAEPGALAQSVVSAVSAAVSAPLPASRSAQLLQSNAEELASALVDDLNSLPMSLALIFDDAHLLGADSTRLLLTVLDQLNLGHRTLLISDEPGAALTHINRDVRIMDETALIYHAPRPDGAAAWAEAPADVRRALLSVALHDTWTAAQGVTPQILRGAHEAGLTITSYGEDLHRPHALLRRTLTQALDNDPQQRRDAHLSAARQYLTAGRLIEALSHYRDAQAYPEAVKLGEQLLSRWLHRDEWPLITTHLSLFPDGTLSPTLEAWYAVALLESGAVEQAVTRLNAQVTAGRATDLTYFGLAKSSIREGLWDAVLHLTEQGLAVTSSAWARVRLLRLRSGALIGLKRTAEAVQAAESALAQARALAEPGVIVPAVANYAFALEHDGQRDEALVMLRSAVQSAFEGHVPHKAMDASQRLADILRDQGHLDEALGIIERMLPVCRIAFPGALAMMTQFRAEVHLHRGAFRDALNDALTAARHHAQHGRLSHAQDAYHIAVLAATFAGDLNGAQDAAARAQQTQSAGADSWHPYAPAVLALHQEDLERARQILTDILATQPPVWSDKFMFSHAFLAEIARQDGTLTDHDMDLFYQVTVQPGPAHLGAPMVHKVLTPLLRTCIDRGRHADEFARYLAAPTSSPETLPLVHLHLLGQVQIQIGSRPVSFLTPVTLDLFVFLATRPDWRASELQISQAFYPHLPESEAMEHTWLALRHLRQTLNTTGLPRGFLRFRNGTWQLHGARMQCDVAALRDACAQGSSDVLRLYRGDFMPGAPYTWSADLRSELRLLASTTLIAIGQRTGLTRPEYAATLYRKAAMISPESPQPYELYAELAKATGDDLGAMTAHLALDELSRGVLPSLFFSLLD
ncbi:hypothetical protein [Deinococcus soli (ex Cha et al. 2016)]|uniref:Tetratricopeptide (TPR) repeat protein n=2 Tax=Deinococcus soli (ex Cha et al. 2016) TaxID=1309411 RepID=A0AAE4BKZ0_9DEIO|nr:hypothetical protein [Deinococcus soli (ex Cha et al. 2016)]MDR6218343.1 tetratricopeptide (TPR) repeat protein [Deinococcus soli (ex Cha et al. 2016)]MDR6329083.1 tetratricopeptide (TPR) repeat protein [Deinococcus soli (ex Cha et al. 2016)]MDR6751356.1 tetratricopeptide (TPR) repeat protein [Deinococcus soli (ex Cha et al. 2016)]